MSKHTPGPWRACKDGKCKCGQIWCDDYPIAEVTRGDWGDTYPSLRLEGPSMDAKAVPFMEMSVYGSVGDETASANARLIAAAPDLLVACKTLQALIRARADRWSDSAAEIDGAIQQIEQARAAIAKAEGG